MTRRNQNHGRDEAGAVRAEELLQSLRPRPPDVEAFDRIREVLRSQPPPPPAGPGRSRRRFWGGGGLVALVAAALLLGRARSVPLALPTSPLPQWQPQAVTPLTTTVPTPVATPPGPAPFVPAPPPVVGKVATEPTARPSESRPSRRHAQATAPLSPSVGIHSALPPVEPSPDETARERQHRIEGELVSGAIQALRRDRDPARALTLLDFYRDRYPEGSLREEALGLSIEAAQARHDRRARSFAQEYLELFPAGRYRATATRVASGAAE